MDLYKLVCNQTFAKKRNRPPKSPNKSSIQQTGRHSTGFKFSRIHFLINSQYKRQRKKERKEGKKGRKKGMNEGRKGK